MSDKQNLYVPCLWTFSLQEMKTTLDNRRKLTCVYTCVKGCYDGDVISGKKKEKCGYHYLKNKLTFIYLRVPDGFLFADYMKATQAMACIGVALLIVSTLYGLFVNMSSTNLPSSPIVETTALLGGEQLSKTESLTFKWFYCYNKHQFLNRLRRRRLAKTDRWINCESRNFTNLHFLYHSLWLWAGDYSQKELNEGRLQRKRWRILWYEEKNKWKYLHRRRMMMMDDDDDFLCAGLSLFIGCMVWAGYKKKYVPEHTDFISFGYAMIIATIGSVLAVLASVCVAVASRRAGSYQILS